jgi:hypothetical protein
LSAASVPLSAQHNTFHSKKSTSSQSVSKAHNSVLSGSVCAPAVPVSGTNLEVAMGACRASGPQAACARVRRVGSPADVTFAVIMMVMVTVHTTVMVCEVGGADVTLVSVMEAGEASTTCSEPPCKYAAFRIPGLVVAQHAGGEVMLAFAEGRKV